MVPGAPGGPVLLAAPSGVALDSDDEAVVKKDSDVLGFTDTVCLQPGSPALNTNLWCDVPLSGGDRLVGFTMLAFDPVTGISYYEALVEH